MSDRMEFEAWYRHEYPRLLAALILVTGNRETAEDVVAEALARCLERWDGPKRPDDPSAWTYTVAVNLARKTWRRRKREKDLVASVVMPEELLLDEPSVELWQAVAGLPQRTRIAVVLRYMAGLTEPQIARIMKVETGTVSAMLSRARTTLARDPRLADPETPGRDRLPEGGGHGG